MTAEETAEVMARARRRSTVEMATVEATTTMTFCDDAGEVLGVCFYFYHLLRCGDDAAWGLTGPRGLVVGNQAVSHRNRTLSTAVCGWKLCGS